MSSSSTKSKTFTTLQLFERMHEEKSHSNKSFSLTQPQTTGEMLKDIQQERHTQDNFSGRTWYPAMVIHNLESSVKKPFIGDREIAGGHKLVYTSTGDRAISVRCLVPGNILRHPVSIDDPIIERYPKFTCDLNTLNSIPPVGSIIMVMWNNNNIRNGGIILGYALGGQRQQDDFTIFSTLDGCEEVVPTNMKTTHAAGETLPAENKATSTELKLDKTQSSPRDSESAIGTAAPNTRWKEGDPPPPTGSAAETKVEKKKDENTPADVPNINRRAQPKPQETQIVCNKSYTVGETTQGAESVSEAQAPPKSKPQDVEDCRIERLAKSTGMPARLLKAFMAVESGGRGPRAIRFEPHIFLGVAAQSNISYGKARPDLRAKVPYTPRAEKGKSSVWYLSRIRKETNRAAFENAYKHDKKLAIQSCSWGQFQVMGHHLLKMYEGYPDAAMTAINNNPQDVSDRLLSSWIRSHARFRRTVKAGEKTGNYDFVKLARYYNGKGQAEAYGKKLKEYYDKLEGDELCQNGVPKNNPRPALVPPNNSPNAQQGLTLDSWVNMKFKGTLPATEIILDGPAGPRGTKSLIASDVYSSWKRLKEGYDRAHPNGPALQVNSAYRSYSSQLLLRRSYLLPKFQGKYNRLGGPGSTRAPLNRADKWLAHLGLQKDHFIKLVAKPGKSNHNSGIAIDFQTHAAKGLVLKKENAQAPEFLFYDERGYSSKARWADKPAHRKIGRRNIPNSEIQPWAWLAKNAHRYGFIRTVDKERWHFVFVGESAVGKRFSKISKNHGTWDGLAGHQPAKAKARARREAAARRQAAKQSRG